MSHVCHAQFCQVPCKPQHLMCARHWAMVSKPVQARVCAEYRPGQCDDKEVSRAWLLSALTAVAEVSRAEGWPMSRRQRELLEAA